MRRRRNRRRRGDRSSLEQLCGRLAYMAQSNKAAMCERNAGPVDSHPALFFRLYGTDDLLFTPLPYGHPVSTIPPILERILEQDHPDFVAVVTESYMGLNSDKHHYQYGQLQRDFKNNPTSYVKEALLIAAVDTRHGRHRSTGIPFIYDDDGMPRFTTLPWCDGCQGKLGELLDDFVCTVQRRAGW